MTLEYLRATPLIYSVSEVHDLKFILNSLNATQGGWASNFVSLETIKFPAVLHIAFEQVGGGFLVKNFGQKGYLGPYLINQRVVSSWLIINNCIINYSRFTSISRPAGRLRCSKYKACFAMSLVIMMRYFLIPMMSSN